MPAYIFTDSSNALLLPEGDYIIEVEATSDAISKGGKTSGCETIELKCRVENHGNLITERIIFHPTLYWKIDIILKALGHQISKNSKIEVTGDMLTGRRAWVHIIQEDYTDRNGISKKSNKVGMWLLNKPLEHIAAPPPPATTTASDNDEWN